MRRAIMRVKNDPRKVPVFRSQFLREWGEDTAAYVSRETDQPCRLAFVLERESHFAFSRVEKESATVEKREQLEISSSLEYQDASGARRHSDSNVQEVKLSWIFPQSHLPPS